MGSNSGLSDARVRASPQCPDSLTQNTTVGSSLKDYLLQRLCFTDGETQAQRNKGLAQDNQ